MIDARVIAHRGGAGLCPENTMAAFAAALARGDPAVETDVAMTRDGVAVLVHDDTLERTGKDPRAVGELTYRELAGIDVGAWFDPAHRGERVPTLDELGDLMAARPVRLFLDFKHGDDRYPGIVDAVIRFAARFGEERITLLSLNHAVIEAFRQRAPRLASAYSIMRPPEADWLARLPQGRGIAPSLRTLSVAMLVQARSEGRAVHAWTVRSQAEAELVVRLPVAGIITDRPDLAAFTAPPPGRSEVGAG